MGHNCARLAVSTHLKTYVKSSIRIVAAVTLAGVTATAAQTLTIPEMIERVKPKPLELRHFVEWALPPFDEVAVDADLVVLGMLAKMDTYLSEDKRTLYTDYELTPITYVASKANLGPSRPGPLPTYVVRAEGGEATIGGTKVSVTTVGEEPIPAGVPVVAFLAFRKEIGKYEIYPGYLFEVVNAHIRPTITEPGIVDARLDGRELTSLVSDVRARRRDR
jgi:hypothetical protein